MADLDKRLQAEEDQTGMHGPSPILGPDGQPARRQLSLREKQELAEEIARPELIGTRVFWDQSAATGLTPTRLATLLRASIRGDIRAYLELAEEMEERDPHYFSVLGTRKRALTQIKPSIEPASKSADDVKIAGEVEALSDGNLRPFFQIAIADRHQGVEAVSANHQLEIEFAWMRVRTNHDRLLQTDFEDRYGDQFRVSRIDWAQTFVGVDFGDRDFTVNHFLSGPFA